MNSTVKQVPGLVLAAALALTGVDSQPAYGQAPAPSRQNAPASTSAPVKEAPVNSQVQVSRQFLRALLRGDYAAAYGQLAPEVRRGVSAARFRQLARPIVAQRQRRGQTIELYKVGIRLDEAGQGGQPFVAFAWTADAASAQRMPPQWLEVTFQDAEARQVLEFQLRHR